MLYLRVVIIFLGGCFSLQLNPATSLSLLRRAQTVRDCKPLRIQNGRIRTRSRSIFAQFTCNKGFILAGEKYIKCIRGSWSGTPPLCVRNACKKIAQPRNGFIFESSRGAILNFFCLPGFTLHGFRSVYCDGTIWNGQLPSCLASNSTPSLSCDFESEDMCGWTHDLNHDFDWTRRIFNENNNSSSIKTGPRYDHTFGPDGQGHYMHIEASSGKINDTSRLISPIYQLSPQNKTFPSLLLPPEPQDSESELDLLPSESLTLQATNAPLNLPVIKTAATNLSSQTKDMCIRLFYHLSGDAGQQLRVYASPTSEKWDLKPENALFWISGNYGEGWHRAVLMVGEVEKPFQIIVEGVSGEHFTSDIAIDDVSLIENCDYAEEAKDSEKLTTAPEILQIESCLNRCNGEKSSNETESLLISCACDENCVLKNTCCPDFTAICVLGNTYEEFFTEASTTEQIWTTELIDESTTTKFIPIHINEDENDMDNNINPMVPPKTSKTTFKETVVPTIKTTAVPSPFVKTAPGTTKSTTATTELDFSFLSDRPDILFTNAPTSTNRDDVVHTDTFPPGPEEPKAARADVSKFARITVSNATTKTSGAVPQYLVIVGVVCFALVGVVATAALIKKYAMRRCRHLGRGRGGAHGDSQSDVRFLTSDEILDFTLQRPSDDYNTI